MTARNRNMQGVGAVLMRNASCSSAIRADPVPTCFFTNMDTAKSWQ